MQERRKTMAYAKATLCFKYGLYDLPCEVKKTLEKGGCFEYGSFKSCSFCYKYTSVVTNALAINKNTFSSSYSTFNQRRYIFEVRDMSEANKLFCELNRFIKLFIKDNANISEEDFFLLVEFQEDAGKPVEAFFVKENPMQSFPRLENYKKPVLATMKTKNKLDAVLFQKLFPENYKKVDALKVDLNIYLESEINNEMLESTLKKNKINISEIKDLAFLGSETQFEIMKRQVKIIERWREGEKR